MNATVPIEAEPSVVLVRVRVWLDMGLGVICWLGVGGVGQQTQVEDTQQFGCIAKHLLRTCPPVGHKSDGELKRA